MTDFFSAECKEAFAVTGMKIHSRRIFSDRVGRTDGEPCVNFEIRFSFFCILISPSSRGSCTCAATFFKFAKLKTNYLRKTGRWMTKVLF